MAKIEHKELMRRLKRLSSAITSKVDSPNYGGCGVIAAIVGDRLRKFEIMTEVVTPVDDDYGTPPADVRHNIVDPSNMSNWEVHGVRFSHLAVRFRSNGHTYTWDSDGTRRSASTFGAGGQYSTHKKFGNGMSIDEARRVSGTHVGWNKSFDRSQIPMIRHLVDHHLKYGL